MIKTEVKEKVRYSETDQMGFVHHSNYARFYEIGRIDLMDKIGIPYDEMEQMGIIMPVVTVESKFIKPLRFGQDFIIETIIEKEPGSRLIALSNIYVNGELVHSGKVVLAFMSKENMRVCRPPKELVEAFNKSN